MLGASFGTTNFGVNVLTIGTIQTILHAYPDAEISIIDYAREPEVWHLRLQDRDLAVPLVNIRFSKRPWQPNHIAFLLCVALLSKLIPFGALRRKFLASNRVLRHLQNMDCITAISGGDSFSDIYGMERFLYVSLPQLLALLLQKRLILLPQTLGPFKSKMAKSVVRYILSRAEVVFARDYKGVKDAEELLGGNVPVGKLRFSYDVGFVVDPSEPADTSIVAKLIRVRSQSVLVGFNVSGLLFIGGYSKKNMFGLKTEYDQLVYDLLKFFCVELKACVLLVPHVVGPEGSESDSTISRKLYHELNPRYGDQLQLVEDGLNERETKFLIGQCDFFLGARMHACIAALSQTVPTISIAYSDKFIGVMETIGAESLVADPRHSTKEEILRQVAVTFQNRNHIRNLLKKRIPAVREHSLNLLIDHNPNLSTTVKEDEAAVSANH